MNLNQLYKLYRLSNGISTDTRKLIKGQIFFALKGDHFDGNEFTTQALEAGASHCVVDDPTLPVHNQLLLVDNVLTSLQELALMHRLRFTGQVLGITGSNGKTTTKELICKALSTQLNIHATAGNLNNHIGVPLTILNADLAADVWIIEMGTNQPGDIEQLSAIALPSLGLITNIGHSHLEKLIDQQGVFEEKRVMLDKIIQMAGAIFVNASDPYLSTYQNELRSFNYSDTHNQFGKLKLYSNDLKLHFQLTLSNEEVYLIKTNLIGSYNLSNISCTLSIAHFFNIKIKNAIRAIQDYQPDNMRSQLLHTADNQIIIDAYNANPTSMKLSIESFIPAHTDDHLLVLGDMLELGSKSTRFHLEIYNWLKTLTSEYFLVGDEFYKIAKEDHRAYLSTEALAEHLKSQKVINKIILLKGSRGMKLERLVDYL